MQWESITARVSPLRILEHFSGEPYAFLLESSLRHRQRGRYSFIGFAPIKVVRGGLKEWEEWQREFKLYQRPRQNIPSPFPAGWMGYLSYDLGLRFENIAAVPKKAGRIPEFLFGLYDTIITVDQETATIYISSAGWSEKDQVHRPQKTRARIAAIKQQILGLSDTPAQPFSRRPNRFARLNVKSNFTRQEYYRAVQKALAYIKAGDIYQVNLAQQFFFDPRSNFSRTDLYRSLRHVSPASFGGYFDGGSFQIISSSPERFLTRRGQRVQTRPMKGTRPRGTTVHSDGEYRRDLLGSAKDKAELLMITDLERNDLGRVCRYGSVRVKAMRTLERYRTVYQATSTVEGTLHSGKNGFDLLRACFPGGSITGCPKIRSMQIIAELEPSARGIYTGAMGYMNCFGDMDFNILIRTFLVHEGRIHFHAGGGIVADSLARQEYAETLVKAKGLRQCLAEVFG